MPAWLLVTLTVWALGSLNAGTPPQPVGDPAGSGVRVESIGPSWSGASKAGLRPGDVITAWAVPGSEPAGTRAVASLADWVEAEAEHGLRADGVLVTVSRGGAGQSLRLGGGAWMLGAGPVLDGDLEADHVQATAHAARGEQPRAAAIWRELSARAAQAVDPTLATWFALRAGSAELAARNPVAAQSAYAAARAAARERRQWFFEREALDGLARANQAGQQPVAAEAAWTEAVALVEAERPNSPVLPRTLNALAAAQREFGRLDDSERSYARALEMARLICPGSIVEVASLGGLSVTLRRRGDRAGAQLLLDEAASILERFPDHPDRIANAGNRGILLVEQDRLADGERQLQRAEALDRARGTPADAVALAHHGNQGVVAAQRGDFARAELLFRSFVEAAERTSMNPLDRVRGLTNLGNIASERGERERALAAFESAHALAAAAAPNSAAMADALGNLGTARAHIGEEAGSSAAYEEALRIREAISPDAPGVAALLWSLAANAERRGDLAAAERFARRALSHIDRTAPGGLPAARAAHVAARVALARGDLAEARRLQTRGLGIVRDLAPESRLEVSALVTLARIDVREQRLDAAATRYGEAVAALRLQVRRLGAPLDLEAGYIDDADVHRPYVDTLLALGRHGEALTALETFRARSVMDRLATRDLGLGRSDESAALVREQRRLARDYDATLSQLSQLPATAAAEKAPALQSRLREIRARQATGASALRRMDGATADQLSPAPQSVEALRDTLPAGTLALVYHLGVERAAVFAVTRETFRVEVLPLAAADVATAVARWRRLIDRARTGPGDPGELDRVSRVLYDALLGPVAGELRRATRLVIVPDGALHGLAFPALQRPAGGGYVARWKPTSVVPSLTVRALLAARPPRPRHALSAAVFGGVDVGESGAPIAPGSGAVRQGIVAGLTALPGSRREAERVAAAFAPRSQLHIGAAATERAVRQVPRETSVLHIASHGVVNERNPLDSALVLSSPAADADGDNGLLQAWEIFEHVRVDADLVVLSACDTGLGRAFSGEGLLGLTRAFQFAGARVVAASLWTAPDDATALLMDVFYAELRRGRPADEALAGAQRRLLADAGTAHPYFWAGFVLDGDAR